MTAEGDSDGRIGITRATEGAEGTAGVDTLKMVVMAMVVTTQRLSRLKKKKKNHPHVSKGGCESIKVKDMNRARGADAPRASFIVCHC